MQYDARELMVALQLLEAQLSSVWLLGGRGVKNQKSKKLRQSIGLIVVVMELMAKKRNNAQS